MLKLATAITLSMLSCAALAAPPAASTVSGDISIATSKQRRTAVVTVLTSGKPSAPFCVDLASPLDAPLTLKEKGQVIYVPQPIPGLPAGVKIDGPESIAATLAVKTASGATIAFLKSGTPAPSGVDTKKAKTIPIRGVSRQDWVSSNGTRRVIGEEGCLSPGG